jgi:hypothetical protein
MTKRAVKDGVPSYMTHLAVDARKLAPRQLAPKFMVGRGANSGEFELAAINEPITGNTLYFTLGELEGLFDSITLMAPEIVQKWLDEMGMELAPKTADGR